MNRIDRLTAMLLKLQSKKVLTGQEIANHFDISLRTVYRDIRALEEAGVPIGAEAGKGYFIMDGYHLPPIMFTKEEASAMLMAGKFVEKQADKSVAAHFSEAMLKIRAVLKSTEKEYLETLDESVTVLKHSIPREEHFPNHFLTDIKKALVEKCTLHFDYYSNYNDSFSSREVEPLGLCYYGNNWHLIAYCRLRKAVRDFRTDRLMKLSLGDDNFDPTIHGDYRDHVSEVFSGGELTEVQIKVSHKLERFLRDQKYSYGFVKQEKHTDGITMVFMVWEVGYFARWLLMFGKEVEVVAPTQLKEEVIKLTEELVNHHLPTDIGLSQD